MGGQQSSQANASRGSSFLLSGNCVNLGPYSIKDLTSGNIFSVKKAGIRFTIVAISSKDFNNKTVAHFGLLCEDNEFVTPAGQYKYCLLDPKVEIAFSNNWQCFNKYEDYLAGRFCRVLSLPPTATLTQGIVGKVVKVASVYASIITREMSLSFKIKLENPAQETNCIAFCTRVLKTLDFGTSTVSTVMKKQMNHDNWDDLLSDYTCTLIDILLGHYKLGNETAIPILSSWIAPSTVEAITTALRRLSTT